MNGFKIIIFITVCYIAVSSSFADIYEWEDENGIMHFSNYAPPAESKLLMKTKEEPYDEAADRARIEAERTERLELARLELAQREAELEFREAETERRLREADRVAEEALLEADYYRQGAGNRSRFIYGGGGYRCRDYLYGCNDSIYDRWYYRSKLGRNYYRKSHFGRPFKRHGFERYFRDATKDYRHRFGYKSYHRPKGHYSKYKLNSRSKTYYGGNRIGSRSRGFKGRGNFSRGRSGFGRRH